MCRETIDPTDKASAPHPGAPDRSPPPPPAGPPLCTPPRPRAPAAARHPHAAPLPSGSAGREVGLLRRPPPPVAVRARRRPCALHPLVTARCAPRPPALAPRPPRASCPRGAAPGRALRSSPPPPAMAARPGAPTLAPSAAAWGWDAVRPTCGGVPTPGPEAREARWSGGTASGDEEGPG